jgi:hypothetical protein
MADVKTTLVEFTADIFPYCKGDVVALDEAEIKRVDQVIERRDIDKAYKSYKAPAAAKEEDK